MLLSKTTIGITRLAALACASLALVACGGGGGDPAPAPPPPDVRNGSYTVMAGDAREYTLSLNFDASTYSASGNGIAQTGSFTASDGGFSFQPGNATGPFGANTTRFAFADGNAIVGELALAGGPVPFVAARTFLDTVAATAGTYNFVGRIVDTAGAAPNTMIQQARITPDARIITCDDAVIYTIENCPLTSQTTGTVTVNGDLFTAVIANFPVQYRVALIGGEKVFLRASPSTGTLRRFVIGTPAATTFGAGTFTAFSTEPAYGAVTINPGTFTMTFVSPGGTTTTTRGTANSPMDPALTTGSIQLLNSTSGSNAAFFAIGSSKLFAMVGTRNSAVVPGYLALGVRQ